MVKRKSRYFFAQPPQKIRPRWTVVLSLFLIALGIVGLFFVQRSVNRQRQDIRQQASVEDGQIELSFNIDDSSDSIQMDTPSEAYVKPTTETSVEFKINTNNVQTDGVQLVFNLVDTSAAGGTHTLNQPPEFQLNESVGLQAAFQEIEQTTSGYLISAIFLPESVGGTFATASPATFATLSFTPQEQGTIELNFDVENSISTVHGSDPVEDELKTIPTFTVHIDDTLPNADTSPSPSPTPDDVVCTQDVYTCADGTEVGRDPNNNCEFICPSTSASPSPSPSPSPSISPSPSPSPSPDDSQDNQDNSDNNTNDNNQNNNNDNGVGGSDDQLSESTYATCNESCSSNNECDANLRCYNGQCRLATNVTSTNCSQPADGGLAKSCNQYCADSRECGGSLECYFNRCRNPLNLESASCATSSGGSQAALNSQCNTACSSHADCPANTLCYSKSGTCRLATNPSSLSCSPTKRRTVSQTYSRGSSTSYKGGTTTNQQTNLDSSDIVNQDQDIASASASASPSPIAAVVSPSPSASPITIDTEDTALDTANNLILNQLNNLRNQVLDTLDRYGISGPMFLIGLGLLLLLIIIILSVIRRILKKDDGSQPKSGTDKPGQSGKMPAPIINPSNTQAPFSRPSTSPSASPAKSTSPKMAKPVGDAAVTADLSKRIAALKNQPSQSSTATTTSTPPTKPTPPPAQINKKSSQTTSTQASTAVFDQKAAKPQASTPPQKPSMLDRVNQKGIKPPKTVSPQPENNS